MYQRHSAIIYISLIILSHLIGNYCHGEDNINYIMTYRSALEKTLQSAKGIANFLTRPFTKTNNINDTMVKSNDNNSGLGGILNKFKDEIHAIVPGTRWCGDGNIAANDTDVGIFRHTDSCCRQHDKCDFNIESGESYDNLKNNGLFTRSACKCDREFYDCLKDARSPLSYDIGHTYFTILGPQCIAYDYPVVSCIKYGGKRLIMRKCIDYEYDKSKPMTYQWIDNPDF